MAGQRRITRDKAGAGRPTRQSTGRGKKSLLDARRDFLSKRPCACLYRKGIDYNEMAAGEAVRKSAGNAAGRSKPHGRTRKGRSHFAFQSPPAAGENPFRFSSWRKPADFDDLENRQNRLAYGGDWGSLRGGNCFPEQNRFLAASSPGNPQDFSGNRRRLGRRRIHRILRFHPRRNGHGSN